jgi:hypothetical protein
MIFLIFLLICTVEAKCTAQCRFFPQPFRPYFHDYNNSTTIVLGSDTDKGCYECDDHFSVNIAQALTITNKKHCCKGPLPCIDQKLFRALSTYFDVLRPQTGFWHMFGDNPVNLIEIKEVKLINKYDHFQQKLRYRIHAELINEIPGTISAYIAHFATQEEREKEFRILQLKLRLANEARDRDMQLLDDYVKSL